MHAARFLLRLTAVLALALVHCDVAGACRGHRYLLAAEHRGLSPQRADHAGQHGQLEFVDFDADLLLRAGRSW